MQKTPNQGPCIEITDSGDAQASSLANHPDCHVTFSRQLHFDETIAELPQSKILAAQLLPFRRFLFRRLRRAPTPSSCYGAE